MNRIEELEMNLKRFTYRRFVSYRVTKNIIEILCLLIILSISLFAFWGTLHLFGDGFGNIEFNMKYDFDIVILDGLNNVLRWIIFYIIRPCVVIVGYIMPFAIFFKEVRKYIIRVCEYNIDGLTYRERYESILKEKKRFINRETILLNGVFDVKIVFPTVDKEATLEKVTEDEMKDKIFEMYRELCDENPILTEDKLKSISVNTFNVRRLYTMVKLDIDNMNLEVEVKHIESEDTL